VYQVLLALVNHVLFSHPLNSQADQILYALVLLV